MKCWILRISYGISLAVAFESLTEVFTLLCKNQRNIILKDLPPIYDSQSLPGGAPSYTRGSATGRLVARTYGPGTNGDYFAYDALGRRTLKIQQTGSVNYQVSAVYNRASALTSMSYPSGRTISNVFDAAGRLTTFSGTLGDGTTRTYTSSTVQADTQIVKSGNKLEPLMAAGWRKIEITMWGYFFELTIRKNFSRRSDEMVMMWTDTMNPLDIDTPHGK